VFTQLHNCGYGAPAVDDLWRLEAQTGLGFLQRASNADGPPSRIHVAQPHGEQLATPHACREVQCNNSLKRVALELMQDVGQLDLIKDRDLAAVDEITGPALCVTSRPDDLPQKFCRVRWTVTRSAPGLPPPSGLVSVFDDLDGAMFSNTVEYHRPSVSAVTKRCCQSSSACSAVLPLSQ
jgi:hypothetical protein